MLLQLRLNILFICAKDFFIIADHSVFQENASDFVEAGFKKTLRMGNVNYDYTKIEILAKPLSMLTDVSEIEKGRVTLEIKSGTGLWKTVDRQPIMRGGLYKWTQSNVIPCNRNAIRLLWYTKEESHISFQFPNSIKAASRSSLMSSGYQPEMPKELEVVETLYSLIVSWTPSPCADLYDVSYQQVQGGQIISEQVLTSDRPSLTLRDGIETCTEYDVKVSAVIGEEYSDAREKRFGSSPLENQAKMLEVTVVSFLNAVFAKWNTFKQLSCVKKYLITICKEGQGCLDKGQIYLDNSLQYLEYSSTVPLEQ
jgi:hypothetical protein